MPPDARVVSAFRAMKELGIDDNVVKPVLKNLLRVYEKNWTLIEEDNYRVLADAIFDQEENKKTEPEKIVESNNENNTAEDIRKPDEPRKAFKRLRLKYQDQDVPCSDNMQGGSVGSSSKKIKVNNYGPPDDSHPQLHPETVNASEHNVSISSTRFRPKGKQHASSQSLVVRESCYLKEPKPEPGLDVCPQVEVPSSVNLIKPKDEPLTDDANNNFLHPIAILPQDNSSGLPQTHELQPGNVNSRGNAPLPSSDDRTDPEFASVTQGSSGSLDIASSSVGDIQVSLKCDYTGRPGFHAPSLDTVLELVENKYRSANTIDSSFSVAKLLSNICNSCLELGSESAAEPQHQESQRYLTVEQEAFSGTVNEDMVKSTVSVTVANEEVFTPKVPMESMPLDGPGDPMPAGEVDVLSGDINEVLNGQGQDGSAPLDISPLKALGVLVHSDQNGLTFSHHENEKINVQGPVTLVNFAAAELTETVAGSAKPKYDGEVITKITQDSVPLDGPSDLIHADEVAMINGGRNGIIDGEGQESQDGSITSNASPPKVLSDLVLSDQNGVINSHKENEKINGQEPVTSENFAADEPTDTDAGSAKPKFDVEDITKGQESVKISLVNEVDSSPPPTFFYIPRNLIFQNAYVNASLARIGDEECCSGCSGDCLSSKIPCICAQETGGEFAYTSDGLVKESILEECISMNRDPKKHCQFYCNDNECPLERSKSGDMVEPCKGHLVRKFIKECWSKCGCDRQCGNRLVQRGITRKLQVFMTSKGKGWGLRTLEDLPKGAFVCEYVGEILTNTELYERNMKSTLKHAYPVLLDADWGSEKVLKDEEALCLDATLFGNVARFINHRCFDSNMVEIPVEVETPDRHYYHLAFFTTRDIAAMEELTWDYGIDFDDQEHPVKAFRCSCGSKFCRNIKRTRRRRIRC